MSAPPKPSSSRNATSRRELLNQIPDLVSDILLRHLRACEDAAESRVREVIREQHDAAPRALQERAECLRERTWHVTPSMRHSLREHVARGSDAAVGPFDPAAAALNAIAANLAKARGGGIRKAAGLRVARVVLPTQETPPRYDAWIPVKTNYWAGKQLHVEPYMPFLGDQDGDCELAFEVYADMANDAGQELGLSDGEVDKDGKFMVPDDDIERCTYYSIAQMRWREGTRKAILAVLDKFKRFNDDAMWRVLAKALGINDIRRIKAIARVAQDRMHEERVTAAKRSRQIEMDRIAEQAVQNPKDEEMPFEEESRASTNPIRHFCFTCHTFLCAQHADADVEPVIPIEDPAALEREEKIMARDIGACSKACFIYDPRTVPVQPEDDEWTAEEILLLREAVPMFGRDPCNLAIVISSRRCHEVWTKLHDLIEADIVTYEIQQARKATSVEGRRRKQDELQDKSGKVAVSAKSVAEKDEANTTTDQDFVPCHHTGPCTADICTCVKKALYCEATCGCNFGRYSEGGKTGGVVWVAPSAESIENGYARECHNRHFGCTCEGEFCDSDRCECVEQNKACSPDFCHCDCSTLPEHISLSKRKCRNVPASIALHKRTFVGRSEVHGFGLFAGEPFARGELVGVYSGQLIDTRLADMIGRLYDATDRTYIFNVTESLVIDGGLLGSKVKFCNHTKPGDKENCASKLVRVRGDAYVALFTTRSVEPGEEFLFDYRFTGEIPNWAAADADSSTCKDSDKTKYTRKQSKDKQVV